MARKRNWFSHKKVSGYGKKSTSISSWLIVAGAVVAVFALGWYRASNADRLKRTDPHTFCEKGNLPEITMVLIDGSDTLDAVQKELAIANLMKIVTKADIRSRFDVYLARENGKELIKPVFSRCNPGPAGSALNSDSKSDEKRFQEQYIRALEFAFSEAIDQPTAKTSPIMESIRAAATRSFARAPDATHRRVIIVSDMIQNSSALSQYHGIGKFADFEKSNAWSSEITDLGGARVSVWYIARLGQRNVQGIAHQEWWREYFAAINSRLIEVETF